MSATVPITNGDMAAGAQVFAPIGQEAAIGTTPAAPATSAGQQHNTSLHLGLFLLGLGLFIALWDNAGFRMAYDVSLGR